MWQLPQRKDSDVSHILHLLPLKRDIVIRLIWFVLITFGFGQLPFQVLDYRLSLGLVQRQDVVSLKQPFRELLVYVIILQDYR